MILYHGSNIGNLTSLKPQISEHQLPYVYFSTNKVIAILYSVHKVSSPYHWFPYGFNENNIPIYTEYYPNALADIYQGQHGYLYECTKTNDMNNPTNINCAYVCSKPITVDKCTLIIDVYNSLLDFECKNQLIIHRYETLSHQQKSNISEQIKQEIEKNHLLSIPDGDYSQFIKARFPSIWNSLLK